jgi:hypothetical protein
MADLEGRSQVAADYILQVPKPATAAVTSRSQRVAQKINEILLTEFVEHEL